MQLAGWVVHVAELHHLVDEHDDGEDDDDDDDDGHDDDADYVAGCVCRSGSSPGGGLRLWS